MKINPLSNVRLLQKTDKKAKENKNHVHLLFEQAVKWTGKKPKKSSSMKKKALLQLEGNPQIFKFFQKILYWAR